MATPKFDTSLYCSGLNLAGNPQGTKNPKTQAQTDGPINLWCIDINKDNWTNPKNLVNRGCTEDNQPPFGVYRKRQAYCTGSAGVATSTVLCPDGQVFNYNYQTQKGKCEPGTYTGDLISYKEDSRYCINKEGFGYDINSPVPFVGPNFEKPDPNDAVNEGISNWEPKDPNTWNYYTNRFYCDTNNELTDCGVDMVFKGDKDSDNPQPMCRKGEEGKLVENYVPGPEPEPEPEPPGPGICKSKDNPCLEIEDLTNKPGGIYPVPGTDNLSTSCFCQVPFGPGSGVLQQCPTGTVFDSELSICNFPKN